MFFAMPMAMAMLWCVAVLKQNLVGVWRAFACEQQWSCGQSAVKVEAAVVLSCYTGCSWTDVPHGAGVGLMCHTGLELD